MKKSIFILVVACSIQLAAIANGNPYAVNMKAALGISDTASTEQSLLRAAVMFDRITTLHPDQWLPPYYAAYCYARISHQCVDAKTKDRWVDRAQAAIDIAFALEPDHAEVLVMKGFVMQARMNINPGVRGFQYFGETMAYFDKASSVDPENPRPYLWKGVNLLHTPAAFGGGKDKACPLISIALEKFNKFVPSDSLAPAWGHSYAREMWEQCK